MSTHQSPQDAIRALRSDGCTDLVKLKDRTGNGFAIMGRTPNGRRFRVRFVPKPFGQPQVTKPAGYTSNHANTGA